MIRLHTIKTSDAEEYAFMESLLVTTFPANEYRELDQLRMHTDLNETFHNNIIYDNDVPIGFLTYWEFDLFYYVEHFAIHPQSRNGGYGQKVLDFICHSLSLPIVLEVEHPTEEMAKRRIGFYRRSGFTIWENDYQQPPYKKGDGYLPMYLMINGSLDETRHYPIIKSKLYQTVYQMGDQMGDQG